MFKFNHTIKLLFASLLIIPLLLANSASADNRVYRPHLLIMVQDDDKDATPASRQRIMSRIVGELNDVMSAKGYNVYDQSAVTQSFVLPNDRRKARASLIDLARTVKAPPVDAVLLVKLYASASKSPYNELYKLDLRAEGDVLNVKSGQVIGHFETEDLSNPVLPANCDSDCILENVGKHGKVLASDLARALDDKLVGFLKSVGIDAPSQQGSANAPAAQGQSSTNARNTPACKGFPTGYTMSFLGFNDREYRAIEEFLNAFSCVQSIRLLSSSPSKLAFWYEITSNNTVLNRDLRTMLDYMKVKGQVRVSGKNVEVKKIISR